MTMQGPLNGTCTQNLEDIPPSPSVLIIGAGNFGAATALALAKRGGVRVMLVDSAGYPNPRAASHDINKIVRDDYPDKLYMNMLLEAMSKWRHHELYSPFYHQVGMLRADPSNFGDESMAAYRAMGASNASHYLSVDEVRERWNGVFATSDFGELEKILYNPSVGFAEADRALGAVVQAAVDHGVQFAVGEMKRVDISQDGKCNGIELQSGRILKADKVLMATGARTATLLIDSAPENVAIHVGKRLSATGAVSFRAKLRGEQKERFLPIPILKNCLPEVKGESMSILRDGTVKFNCEFCFTNFVDYPFSNERVSVVPNNVEHNVWTDSGFVTFLQNRARKTMYGLYGEEVTDVPIDSFRICWDASTPTHDFLITPHPYCQNLYLATGGSFHSWKFLPVIGDYVADMMQGTLTSQYADRWAWDRVGGDCHSANPTYQIVSDLQDWIMQN